MTLLSYLEAQGFDGTPRYLGVDERRRQVFSYLEGDVPAELDAELSDEALVEAARLIRRFHDATAGSALAGEHETVCHEVTHDPVARWTRRLSVPSAFGPRRCVQQGAEGRGRV